MVYNGTIYESHSFVLEQAVSDVEAAISDGVQMKVLDILTHINNAQRQQLKAAFKAKTGKELEDEVKRVLKERETEDGIQACVPWNDVFAIAVSLLNTRAQEDASWLHKSIDRIGTNEKVLVEILCSRTNAEIASIRAEYEKKFQSKLEDDIAKDTSGTLKAILTALSRGNRDEIVDTDHLHAAEDADKLYKAGEAKLGTDEKVFVDILTTKSWPQLGLIFSEYERLFGHSFEVAIDKEFSRYSKDALQTIFDVHNDKALYFATRIHNACRGPGTRDHDLIRILVGRSEIDLALIRAEFERLYNKSFYETLKDECSGVYLEAFLALVKGNQVQNGQIQ